MSREGEPHLPPRSMWPRSVRNAWEGSWAAAGGAGEWRTATAAPPPPPSPPRCAALPARVCRQRSSLWHAGAKQRVLDERSSGSGAEEEGSSPFTPCASTPRCARRQVSARRRRLRSTARPFTADLRQSSDEEGTCSSSHVHSHTPHASSSLSPFAPSPCTSSHSPASASSSSKSTPLFPSSPLSSPPLSPVLPSFSFSSSSSSRAAALDGGRAASPLLPPVPLPLPVLSRAASSWTSSLSSLVQSLHSKLPFLAATQPQPQRRGRPQPRPAEVSSSCTHTSSSSLASLHTRGRSLAQLRRSSLQQLVALHIDVGYSPLLPLPVPHRSPPTRPQPLDVVIDVRPLRSAERVSEKGRRSSVVLGSGGWRVRKVKEREEEPDEGLTGLGQGAWKRTARRRLSGRDEGDADALLSVVVEASAACPSCCGVTEQPLLLLPTAFPPLQRLAALLTAADPAPSKQLLPPEAEVESGVWSCLWSVERCIDWEVQRLLQSLPAAGWSSRVDSFRALQLCLFDSAAVDERIRRLCMLQPDYAVYLLTALRLINGEGVAEGASSTASAAADSAVVVASVTVCTAFPAPNIRALHRRSRTEGGASLEKRRRLLAATTDEEEADSSPSCPPSSHSPAPRPRLPGHRRASSVGPEGDAAVTRQPCSSSSSSSPRTFADFLCTASGFSYLLRRPAPPAPATAASFACPRAAVRDYLQPFLRCASGVQLLLLSLLYLALLHTTDAAAIRKAHFAAALIDSAHFEEDRLFLPLQPQRARTSRGETVDATAAACAGVAVERGRRRSAMRSLRMREAVFLLDHLCLLLLQHDSLPSLPLATLSPAALPDLSHYPGHVLGLR